MSKYTVDSPENPLDPRDLTKKEATEHGKEEQEDMGDSIRPSSSGSYDLEQVVRDANEIIAHHDNDETRRGSIFTITKEIRKVPSFVNLEAHKVTDAIPRKTRVRFPVATDQTYLSLEALRLS